MLLLPRNCQRLSNLSTGGWRSRNSAVRVVACDMSVHWATLAFVVVTAACGAKEKPQDRTMSSAEATPEGPATPKPKKIANAATDQSPCQAKTATIVKTARAAAQCQTDDQCIREDVELCNIDGLGCYSIILNKDRSREPLKKAIADYIANTCPRSKCDCAPLSSTLRCRDGYCIGTRG